MHAAGHAPEYRRQLEASGWKENGDIRQRDYQHVPRCVHCGAVQPERTPRPLAYVETESRTKIPPPKNDPTIGTVAAEILRRVDAGQDVVRARGLLTALGRRQIKLTRIEQGVATLMATGWIRVRRSVDGTRRPLDRVEVLDWASLEEFVRPGAREEVEKALRVALEGLRDQNHPAAVLVREFLARPAKRVPAELIRALTEVARFAASGGTGGIRVFSATRLGHSKVLERLRGPVEHVLGPLDALGLREGSSLVHLGGRGSLDVVGTTIRLENAFPFLGLSREAVTTASLQFPDGGLFMIENLAVFEAACRGEISDAKDSMVLWLGGWPGRGEESVISAATRAGVRVRIWADLDRSGVGIVRQTLRWNPKTEPYRMTPEDLASCPHRRPLSPAERRRIARDISLNPDGPLRSTLDAILEAGEWGEQESLLMARKAALRAGSVG